MHDHHSRISRTSALKGTRAVWEGRCMLLHRQEVSGGWITLDASHPNSNSHLIPSVLGLLSPVLDVFVGADEFSLCVTAQVAPSSGRVPRALLLKQKPLINNAHTRSCHFLHGSSAIALLPHFATGLHLSAASPYAGHASTTCNGVNTSTSCVSLVHH